MKLPYFAFGSYLVGTSIIGLFQPDVALGAITGFGLFLMIISFFEDSGKPSQKTGEKK